jgi:hypothetical protein
MATAVITSKNPVITRTIENANIPSAIIIGPKRLSVINETLPYRIRFTNIQVPGYSPNNPPGIGLQIIGYSNWII